MTQPTVTVSLGQLDGWVLGTSLLGTDTTLAEYVYTDITDRTLGFSYRRGRQHELDRIEAGTATFTFMNQDGVLTPSNTASSLYPDVRPMAPIKIEATYPPAVAFSPSDIAGLVAWYDFSAISGLWKDTARTSAVTADGDVIKGVTDLSGTAHHLSEATNGPTYKVAITAGRSIARFDGANDALHVTGLTAPSGLTAVAVFVKTGALTASTDCVFSLQAGNSAQFYTNSASHATGMNWFSNNASAEQLNVATGPLSWGTKVIRINSTSSLDVYTGGGTPVNFDPNDTDLSAATLVGLGYNQNDSSGFGDYDIAEFLLYNSALSAADLNALGAYLADKWAVPWTTV